MIDRIKRSAQLINEGIDKCDVPLILESSKNFQEARDKIKAATDEVIAVVSNFPELAGYTGGLMNLKDKLDGVNVDDVTDVYSFLAHAEMRDAQSNDPTSSVVSVSNELSAYVNGLKDAIIEISKWLEQTPELFSVSSQGIKVNPDFAGKNIGSPLGLNTFSLPKGEEILQAIAAEEEEDKLRMHFSQFWNTEDVLPEKEDEAWQKFVDEITKVGAGAQKAYDNAARALANAEPSGDVKKAGESGGILKSIMNAIFGGETKSTAPSLNDIKEDVLGENAANASKGLFAMSFESLQSLVTKLIDLTQRTTQQARETVQKVNDHNDEKMTPAPEQQKLASKLIEIIGDKDRSLQVAAALEKSGMKNSDPKTADLETFKKELGNIGMKEEGIELLIDGLELDEEAVEEGPVLDVSSVIDDFSNETTINKDDIIEILRYNGVIGPDVELTSELTPDSESLVNSLKSIRQKFPEQVSDEVLSKLKEDLLNPPSDETELGENIRRWQKLAGIING